MSDKNKYLVPLIAMVGMLQMTSLQAADTRWTMATGYPDDSFFTKNLRKFVTEVEEASDGRIAIELHSNGTLVSHDEIKRSVQRDIVQLGEIHPKRGTEFGVLTQPQGLDLFFEQRFGIRPGAFAVAAGMPKVRRGRDLEVGAG